METEEKQPHSESNFPSLIGLQPVITVEIVNSHSESQASPKTLGSRQTVRPQSQLKSPSQSDAASEQGIGSEPQSQALSKSLKQAQDGAGSKSQLPLWSHAIPNTNTSEQEAENSSAVVPEASSQVATALLPPSCLVSSLLTTTQSLSSAVSEVGTPSAGVDRNVCYIMPGTAEMASSSSSSSERTFPSPGGSVSQSAGTGSKVSKVPALLGNSEIPGSVESAHSDTASVSHLNAGVSYDLTVSELVELDPNAAELKHLVPQTIPQGREEKETASRTSSRTDAVHPSTSTNSCISKWQRHETLKLIELYKENQQYFEDQHYKKKSVWSLLAAKLAKVSKSKVRYTGTQVSNRWKNLCKMYRDCVQGLPWISKCQYFDQLHSVFGDNKVIVTSQSLKQRRQAKSLKRKATQSSADSGFVNIAPKKPAHQLTGTLSASSSHQSTLANLSEHATPVLRAVSDNESKGLADVVSAVREVHEEQKRRDDWKLEQLERMHKEKMQLFAQFLDLLKEHRQ